MMSKLKIEITEETTKDEMLGFVRAIAAFGGLDVFGSVEVYNVKGSKPEPEKTPEPEEEEKPKKTTKKTSKKTSKKAEKPAEEEVKKDEPAKEEKTSKKEESKSEEKDDSEPELKLEDIRVLARPHIKNHKPAIKDKLTDLGAESIPALETSKYPEFAEFLKGLK